MPFFQKEGYIWNDGRREFSRCIGDIKQKISWVIYEQKLPSVYKIIPFVVIESTSVSEIHKTFSKWLFGSGEKDDVSGLLLNPFEAKDLLKAYKLDYSVGFSFDKRVNTPESSWHKEKSPDFIVDYFSFLYQENIKKLFDEINTLEKLSDLFINMIDNAERTFGTPFEHISSLIMLKLLDSIEFEKRVLKYEQAMIRFSRNFDNYYDRSYNEIVNYIREINQILMV